jgi:hypothetical protein
MVALRVLELVFHLTMSAQQFTSQPRVSFPKPAARRP